MSSPALKLPFVGEVQKWKRARLSESEPEEGPVEQEPEEGAVEQEGEVHQWKWARLSELWLLYTLAMAWLSPQKSYCAEVSPIQCFCAHSQSWEVDSNQIGEFTVME